MIEFIFMLTHNDQTVPDALDVYGTLRDTDLRYVGFKDIGLPPARLRELADAIRADGREVFLEVVSERAEDELRSVSAALDIGVDWLLGGTHPDEALAILDQVGPPGTPGRPRYCPFPGRVVGHPSILEGTIDEIADSARALTARDGVDGLDLLAYRWTGDVPALVRAVVAACAGPVIAAGSVDSAERIQALADAGAWAYTIGGAIFDRKLPGGPERPRTSRLRARHDGRRGKGGGRRRCLIPASPRTRAEPRPHRITWRRTDDQRTRSRRDHPPRHPAPDVPPHVPGRHRRRPGRPRPRRLRPAVDRLERPDVGRQRTGPGASTGRARPPAPPSATR